MTFTDPIGDMFSRIRNGQMRSLNSVEIPSSNFRKNILEILKNEGYIKDNTIFPNNTLIGYCLIPYSKKINEINFTLNLEDIIYSFKNSQ